MGRLRTLACLSWVSLLLVENLLVLPAAFAQAPPRNYPYRELDGRVEQFHFHRNWRHYYWREDFTLLVRDAAGQVHRVISREPTPWAGHRLGTTYTGLAVDWTRRPRVRIIGVQAIDRQPAEFYELALDPEKTITAFIVRVQMGGTDDQPAWRDFYVNNWFHKWGDETDLKILAHYANEDPNYTVYGYLTGATAPVDAAGKKLLEQHPDSSIYHGRIVKANNPVGYEIRILHLLGRSKKTARYEVFHGNPAELTLLDGQVPPEAKKK
jgi:hypothetical protein